VRRRRERKGEKIMEKTKMLKVIADYDDNPVDVTAEINFIE